MSPKNHVGRDENLNQYGQEIGFFRSFADSFWKSTRMELDLVHQEGDS